MKPTYSVCSPGHRSHHARSDRRGTTLVLFILLIPMGALFYCIALDQIDQHRMALAQRENRAQLRLLALSAITVWQTQLDGRSPSQASVALPVEGALEGIGTYRLESVDDPASPFTWRAMGRRNVQLDAHQYEAVCEIGLFSVPSGAIGIAGPTYFNKIIENSEE